MHAIATGLLLQRLNLITPRSLDVVDRSVLFLVQASGGIITSANVGPNPSTDTGVTMSSVLLSLAFSSLAPSCQPIHDLVTTWPTTEPSVQLIMNPLIGTTAAESSVFI